MKKIILIKWINNLNDFNYIKDLDNVYIDWGLYLAYNKLKEFNYNKSINWSLFLPFNNLTEFNYNKNINWSLGLYGNNLKEFNYNKHINWYLFLYHNNLKIKKEDLKCKVKGSIYL